MKKIKINFSDFYRSFDKENNDFTNILRKRYDVEISDTPDFLFYSSFGRDYLNYDCIKIFYTGECVVPDFNLCDYAIAFEKMQYGDRYLRVPLYELFQYRSRFENVMQSNTPKIEKTAFCSFVVSNDQGMKERTKMVELLNKYKTVDSGGRYKNNVGGPIKDKFAFDQTHKFSICFENCSQRGYTTEKIVEAFAAGCIPIYYGNPDIGVEFNTKAFVNVHDFNTLEDAVKRIIEIDQNEELYKEIKSEPIFIGDTFLYMKLHDFLFHIVNQPLNTARRRPYNTRIAELESDFKLIRRYEDLLGKRIKRVKALVRRYKNNAL